jgi:Tol biopolymer transport system component
MRRKSLYGLFLFLVFGFVLGASLTLIAQTSFVPIPTPEPTPWPTMPPYPTNTPMVDTQLPANCYEGYQLQWVSNVGSYYEMELPSPDGQSILYSEAGNVYLKTAGKPPMPIENDGTFGGDLPTFGYWSPNSRYLAWIRPLTNLVMVMDADGNHLRQIQQVEFPAAFLGWSPDSTHVALQQHYLSDVTVWTLDGVRTFATSNPDLLIQYSPFWSPDGNWLVINWRDNSGLAEGKPSPTGFTLAAADGSTSYDIQLSDGVESEPFRHQVAWSSDSRMFSINYLQYTDRYIETVNVYDTEGNLQGELSTEITDPVYSGLSLWSSDWSPVHWSSDGQIVTYIRPVAMDQFDLMSLDVTEGEFKPLAQNLDRPPFYASGMDYLAAYEGQERPFSIDILEVSGENHVPLVTDASDAGNPDWSPSGEWVAAVWATGNGESRRVFLSWMHPDGTGRQDMDADFRDVRDLRWITGESELAYIAWRGDEASIEIADTETGTRRTLAEGFTQIADFTYDVKTYTLSFWWQNAKGERGKDIYRLDRTRSGRILYNADLERPRKEFWSPDREMVAIKVGTLFYRGISDEHLILAFTDGREPLLIRSGLSGLGDPIWSPDGQSLAFTQSRGRSDAALHRVNTSGINLWEYTPYPVGRTLEWEGCG